MTDLQKLFLQFAVIDRLSYNDISKKLNIDREEFAPWWNELKIEREYLTTIRDLWLRKCPEIEFTIFRDWYERTEKKCHYCGLTESDMSKLWIKHPNLTKRGRGRKLEIDRLQPNLDYQHLSNLVFCCYWCNNAKTDTFTDIEFSEVGKVISQIWKNRLK